MIVTLNLVKNSTAPDNSWVCYKLRQLQSNSFQPVCQITTVRIGNMANAPAVENFHRALALQRSCVEILISACWRPTTTTCMDFDQAGTSRTRQDNGLVFQFPTVWFHMSVRGYRIED